MNATRISHILSSYNARGVLLFVFLLLYSSESQALDTKTDDEAHSAVIWAQDLKSLPKQHSSVHPECSQGQDDPSTQRIARRLFSELNPDALCELTLPTDLLLSLKFDVKTEMPLNEVQRLRGDLAWKGVLAKYFHPIPTTARYQLQKTLDRLISIMEKNRISNVNFHELSLLAIAEITRLQDQKLIGDCYTIQSYEKPLMASRKTIALPYATQSAIDSLFKNPVNEGPFSDQELVLLNSGRLSNEELGELRAIRKATEHFARNSPLMNDKAGGVLSNLHAEAIGEGQMTCADHMETYSTFLETLRKRGLLRHFRAGVPIGKKPSLIEDWTLGGHVALKVRNERTGESFVLDSWYEKGSSAAHILTEDNWMKLPVNSTKPLKFNDVVRLLD